jgi:multicomponent Na+:H+ antiporter subunit A
MNGTSLSPILLAAALGTPLALLALSLSPRWRDRLPALLALAPVPALAAALFAANGTPLVFDRTLGGVTLALDAPGAVLLGAVALLWIAAGAYASAYVRCKPRDRRFAIWWLFMMTGNLGVFIAADMASFYLFFSLAGLAAYGLIVDDGTPRAKHAGLVYIVLAVLGEAFLFRGFVLLAAGIPDGHLLREAVAALPTSRFRDGALLFLIFGSVLKLGLFPLHFWIPLAHSVAPVPASAVLSGAAVNVGVIALVRVLPFETDSPAWGEALAAVGLVTAFYGIAIGITQTNPKTVLAYSTVSQMGLLAAVLGMGLATGDDNTGPIAAFYAARHALVKGALFLAVGVILANGARRLPLILLPAAVLALSLGGLPFTGGALAKLAVKAPLGPGTAGVFAALSAAGTALLMMHFLFRLAETASQGPKPGAPPGSPWPWLATTLAFAIVSWALYPVTTNQTLIDAFTPTASLEALWPALIGATLAIPLWLWGRLLPRIPEGDVVVIGEKAAHAMRNWGEPLERAETFLKQWPVAGMSLLAIAIILGATMLSRP